VKYLKEIEQRKSPNFFDLEKSRELF